MKTLYWLIAGAIASATVYIKVYDGDTRQNKTTIPTIANSTVDPRAEEDTAPAVSSSVRSQGQGQEAEVYQKGQGNRSELASPPQFTKNEHIPAQGSHQNTDPAKQDLERSVPEQSELDASTVLKALQDLNPKIRFQALTRFHGSSNVLPPDTLSELAHNDSSEGIRLAALRFIASSPSTSIDQLRSTAELALSDPSDTVRTQASDILEQMANVALVTDKLSDPQKIAQ
jgi:hypothetical protein